MMVKVLVHAHATGVFSSRKIAKKLHEDVAFRVLGASNLPAHRSSTPRPRSHVAKTGSTPSPRHALAWSSASARLIWHARPQPG